MPLFFMISGMCYRQGRYSTFGAYVRRKCSGLLKPFFIFLAINLVLTYALQIDYYTIEKVMVFDLPLAMWFVFVLLWVELAFYFVAKLPRCGIVMSLLVISCCSLFLEHFQVRTVLSLTTIPIGLVFYGIGYLMRDPILRLCASRHRYYVSLVALGLAIPLLQDVWGISTLDLMSNTIGFPQPVKLVAAVGTSLALIKLCAMVPWGKLGAPIRWIGANTMTIICLHILWLHVALTYIHVDSRVGYKIMEMVFVVGMSVGSAYVVRRWLKAIL